MLSLVRALELTPSILSIPRCPNHKPCVIISGIRQYLGEHLEISSLITCKRGRSVADSLPYARLVTPQLLLPLKRLKILGETINNVDIIDLPNAPAKY